MFTVVLVSLLSSAGSVLVYHRFYATKFAMFDLAGYLTGIQSDAAKLGPGEEKAAAEKIQKSLDVVEKMVTGQPDNTIVLTSDVILGKSSPVKKLELAPSIR